MSKRTSTTQKGKTKPATSKKAGAHAVEDLRPAAVAVTGTTPAQGTANKVESIRNTIRSQLLSGASTATITAAIATKFPSSKAAGKPSTHIAFYRSQLRKEGLLPPAGK